MIKTKPITRSDAKYMIRNENYRFIVSFVSAAFEDISLYYKRKGKEYYIINYEDTNESWANLRLHCDLDGFLEKIDIQDDSNPPDEEDIEQIIKARPEISRIFFDDVCYLATRLLRYAIEDKDSKLEYRILEFIK